MDLNKVLANIRKATLEIKSCREEVERINRRNANQCRRGYRSLDSFVNEGKKLVDSFTDTSEFDKVIEEIKENKRRRNGLK